MNLLDGSDLPLERLRALQPIPLWAIKTLSVFANPILWLAILVVAFFRATHFQPWAMGASSVLLVPIIGVMYYSAKRLARDIEPDTRGLPAQVEEDEELRRVVERLTRNGGIVRAGQREVIDAYVKARYRSGAA
jgi:hypothetical protein